MKNQIKWIKNCIADWDKIKRSLSIINWRKIFVKYKFSYNNIADRVEWLSLTNTVSITICATTEKIKWAHLFVFLSCCRKDPNHYFPGVTMLWTLKLWHPRNNNAFTYGCKETTCSLICTQDWLDQLAPRDSVEN